MRVFAAILAVILGSSASVAQSDPRANPAPAAEAAPAAKPEAQAKSEPKKPAKQAAKNEAKPDTKAEAKTEAKADGDAVDAKAKGSRKEKAAAKAKPATTGSAPAAAPPAKPSGLQDTYAAIPPAERMAIQNDLTWGGDFTGPIDGEFSERLVAAVKAYQSRHKNPVTGVMSPAERAALAAAVEPRKQESAISQCACANHDQLAGTISQQDTRGNAVGRERSDRDNASASSPKSSVRLSGAGELRDHKLIACRAIAADGDAAARQGYEPMGQVFTCVRRDLHDATAAKCDVKDARDGLRKRQSRQADRRAKHRTDGLRALGSNHGSTPSVAQRRQRQAWLRTCSGSDSRVDIRCLKHKASKLGPSGWIIAA